MFESKNRPFIAVDGHIKTGVHGRTHVATGAAKEGTPWICAN
jgi:hypothetical protein